jgi:hypothetical protein
MKNHQKGDKVSVNIITAPNDIKAVSDKPIGNASENPSCIYDHKRHAAGSKIINTDGSEMICSKEGSWKNKKQH